MLNLFLDEIKISLIKLIKNIEWIFIATPNQTHYKIVKKCIMNSINVFCEKPLCLSYEKAKELILLARKKGKIIYK